MNGNDKLKDNIEQLFHPNRGMIYCKNRGEIDEFMDMAEYIGIKWYKGASPRESMYSNKFPIVFINSNDSLICAYPPTESHLKAALPISAFRNYVIAVRNRRT